MKFGQKQTMRDKVAVASRNKNQAGSKDIAPVAKPKIKLSGTNPFKKKIGIKAEWKF